MSIDAESKGGKRGGAGVGTTVSRNTRKGRKKGAERGRLLTREAQPIATLVLPFSGIVSYFEVDAPQRTRVGN